MRGRLASISTVALAWGCVAPPPPELPESPKERGPGPLRLWSAAAVDELYEPGEVRAWSLRQGDHELGTTWGRYVGSPEGEPNHHWFETKVELLLPGRSPLRSEGEIVLDARGHLVRCEERTAATEIRCEREDDRLLMVNNGAEQELTYDPLKHDTAFWGDTAILHEELMFGLRPMQVGELRWRVLSLSGGPPVEWQGEAKQRIRQGHDVIEVETSLGETLVLVDRRIQRVEVEDDRLVIEVMDPPPPWPSWEVEPPIMARYSPPADAPFTIRPVEIPATQNEPRLAGEVVVPDRAKPLPGVVFLAGAGPQDRHGLAGVPPIDLGTHEITDGLAAAGFVVLRYDARGIGESDPGPSSFSAQVRDAKRALATLVVQDEVDPDRVLLVGHGEGGWRALIVASKDPFVRGVALLAAPGRPYEQVLADQAEVSFARLPPKLREEARKNHEQLVASIRDPKFQGQDSVPEAGWLREVFKVDPSRLLSEVTVPLWLGQGGKDFEVDPEKDLSALVKAARKSGREFAVHRYDDLDHLFKPEPQTSSPERYRVPDRNVDPEVIADLVRWARKVVPP